VRERLWQGFAVFVACGVFVAYISHMWMAVALDAGILFLGAIAWLRSRSEDDRTKAFRDSD
jgi:hypothetical protein